MVAPPQNNIREFVGTMIGLNATLARIEELRNILNEMDRLFADDEPSRREILSYLDYEEELEYLVSQVNNQ